MRPFWPFWPWNIKILDPLNICHPMITKSKENHYFSILWLSGLQNDLLAFVGLFQYLMDFLVSCKATSTIQCQIFAKKMFLGLWYKISPNLPVWDMKVCCDGDNIGKRYNVRTRGYYHDLAINRLSPQSPFFFWKCWQNSWIYETFSLINFSL